MAMDGSDVEALRVIQPSIEEALGVLSDRSPWWPLFSYLARLCNGYVGEYEPPAAEPARGSVEEVPNRPRCARITRDGTRCHRKTTDLFCPQHAEGME